MIMIMTCQAYLMVINDILQLAQSPEYSSHPKQQPEELEQDRSEWRRRRDRVDAPRRRRRPRGAWREQRAAGAGSRAAAAAGSPAGSGAPAGGVGVEEAVVGELPFEGTSTLNSHSYF